MPKKNLQNDTTVPDIAELAVTILPKTELQAKNNADNKTYIIPLSSSYLFILFHSFYIW